MFMQINNIHMLKVHSLIDVFVKIIGYSINYIVFLYFIILAAQMCLNEPHFFNMI